MSGNDWILIAIKLNLKNTGCKIMCSKKSISNHLVVVDLLAKVFDQGSSGSIPISAAAVVM